MEYIILGAVGYYVFELLTASNGGRISRVMDHYNSTNEVRSANSTTQSSLLLDQLTFEDRRNHAYALATGNQHAAIALQGMFVKERVAYPQQSFAQKSYTMSQQAYQQTLPGEKRSLFNINFTRTPTALGDQRPGFQDFRISKGRVRL
jgi:hypothetical protein